MYVWISLLSASFYTVYEHLIYQCGSQDDLNVPVLSRQYAAIVFMSNHKFETSKKKVLYLNFHDFAHCSNEMIQHWSYSSKGEKQFLKPSQLFEISVLRCSPYKYNDIFIKKKVNTFGVVCVVDRKPRYKNLRLD